MDRRLYIIIGGIVPSCVFICVNQTIFTQLGGNSKAQILLETVLNCVTLFKKLHGQMVDMRLQYGFCLAQTITHGKLLNP